MEKLVDEGIVRSIGISNYDTEHLEEILSFARIKPAVNQASLPSFLRSFLRSLFSLMVRIVRRRAYVLFRRSSLLQIKYHAYNAKAAEPMLSLCEKHSILIEAYSSLTPLTAAPGSSIFPSSIGVLALPGPAADPFVFLQVDLLIRSSLASLNDCPKPGDPRSRPLRPSLLGCEPRASSSSLQARVKIGSVSSWWRSRRNSLYGKRKRSRSTRALAVGTGRLDRSEVHQFACRVIRKVEEAIQALDLNVKQANMKATG
jgi:hypothetical protein